MSWHYLPVYTEHEEAGETVRTYGLCQAHFDSEGRLTGWTESCQIPPQGETIDELRRALANMMRDTRRWSPVRYDSLEVGMVFDELQPEHGNALNLIQAGAEALELAVGDLLAVTDLAAAAAKRRSDDIDAILAAIRRLRTE